MINYLFGDYLFSQAKDQLFDREKEAWETRLLNTQFTSIHYGGTTHQVLNLAIKVQKATQQVFEKWFFNSILEFISPSTIETLKQNISHALILDTVQTALRSSSRKINDRNAPAENYDRIFEGETTIKDMIWGRRTKLVPFKELHNAISQLKSIQEEKFFTTINTLLASKELAIAEHRLKREQPQLHQDILNYLKNKYSEFALQNNKNI